MVYGSASRLRVDSRSADTTHNHRSPEESTGNCELRNQRRRLEDPVLRRFSGLNKHSQRRKHWDEPEALFQIYGGTGGRNQRPQREREGWPSQIENKIDN